VGNTPVKAGAVVVFVAGICSWINWGFGLIVGGLLALQVAKRTKGVDFAYLIAAAYSGLAFGIRGSQARCPS
jgi:short-chain fatty acids transporter